MKRLPKYLLAVAGTAALMGTAVAQQPSVGINFSGRNPAYNLEPTDMVGVKEQGYWQNMNSDANNNDGTALGLVDSDGKFSAVTFSWVANDNWRADYDPTNVIQRLMRGIIKANPSPDDAPLTDPTRVMTFTFGGLPSSSTFDVIAYGMHNGAGPWADYAVGGVTYYTIQPGEIWDGLFVRGTATTEGERAIANYVRWDNVSPDAQGNIVVTVKKTDLPQITDGIGVPALQLVLNSGAWPTNSTAPIITAQPPADILGVVGDTVTISVGLNGPWQVQWQTNNVNIPGATGTTLNFLTTAALKGAKLRAIISNNVGTVTSSETTLELDDPQPEVLVRGFMKGYHYGGIGNTAVNDLYNNAKYQARNYDYVFYVAGGDVPDIGQDDFGREFECYVYLDAATNWDFAIRSDDASALYVNPAFGPGGTTNNLPVLPSHYVEGGLPNLGPGFIYESTCCGGWETPGNPETQTIYGLGPGLFGIGIVYKEGTGGDYVQWAVRKNTDPDPNPVAFSPVPPDLLYCMASPAGKRANVTLQPQSQTVAENKAVIFKVDVETKPSPKMFGVQWMVNGVDIPGATGDTLTLDRVALSDNGKKYSAKIYTLLGVKTSDEATLTVQSDTTPPEVKGVGAIAKSDGTTVQFGVEFNELVSHAAAINSANYTLSKGTVTGVRHYPFVGSADFDAVILEVSGVANGDSVNVTVANVADAKGNAMATPTSKTVKINTAIRYAVIGGREITTRTLPAGSTIADFPDDVIPLSNGDYVALSASVGHWDNYDEQVFIYEAIEGDFERVVRVEEQDPSSNWARAGMMAREQLQEGMDRTTMATQASRNFNIRANPVRRWDGSAANNQVERHRRSTTGGNYEGGSFGAAPAYPNQWFKLTRVGNKVSVFRSEDNGVTWTQPSDAGDMSPDPAWPSTLYVGAFYASELNNNDSIAGLGHSPKAIFRQFGAVVPSSKLSIGPITEGSVTIKWDAGQQLYTAPSAVGPWTATGNTSGSLTEQIGSGAKFFATGQ